VIKNDLKVGGKWDTMLALWLCGIWFALSREEVARKWKEVVCNGNDAKRGKKFCEKWM